MSYESKRIIILSEIQMLTTKNVSKHRSVNSKKCALIPEEEQNPLMIIIHLFHIRSDILMIKMDVSFKYGSTFCFILLSDKGYVNFSNSHFECILCGLMIELVDHYRHRHHSLQWKKINHSQKIYCIKFKEGALYFSTTFKILFFNQKKLYDE